MSRPDRENAQQAIAFIDQCVSALDCKGLTLIQCSRLISAIQIAAAYAAPEEVAAESAPPAMKKAKG